MKLLILGKNGQVGWELQRALQPLGDVLALDRHQDAKTQYCGDIANFDAIAQIITQFCPDVVVNATAYTAVDKANLINHLAVQHLAEQCKAINALLIHYSTDYVFNGEGQASWQEDDPKAPINAYGKTKLQGEIALEQSQTKFINFRTSWVYGTHGNNFIKTMLKLAQTKDELNIIVDQIGVPTNAALIADVTAQVIRYYVLNPSLQDKLHGHYHLAPRGETSWYDFAQLIFAQARSNGVELKVKQVGAIPTTGYPTPAKRPLNSRLNTQKLQQTFYIHLPEWQQGVEHVIAEII